MCRAGGGRNLRTAIVMVNVLPTVSGSRFNALREQRISVEYQNRFGRLGTPPTTIEAIERSSLPKGDRPCLYPEDIPKNVGHEIINIGTERMIVVLAQSPLPCAHEKVPIFEFANKVVFFREHYFLSKVQME